MIVFFKSTLVVLELPQRGGDSEGYACSGFENIMRAKKKVGSESFCKSGGF